MTLVVAAIVLFSSLFSRSSDVVRKLTYSELLVNVDRGFVDSLAVDASSGRIDGELQNGTKFEVQGPSEIPATDYQRFDEAGVRRDYKPHHDAIWPSVLAWLIPVVLIVAFFWIMGRRAVGQTASIMSFGRSRAKVYTTERPRTTFADVAGYSSVKEEVQEVVEFLKHPTKFREIGARIPKGVLLVGPPGTGKTLIARAVAGEAGVQFTSVTGSDFMEMFVGVGAARVRDLFETARKGAPAIVFIDEIDSIGRKRGTGLGGGHDEREQTLNQLLAEMDGFETMDGIVMIAATNRPDILDPALLRPGRFDRQVVVPLPTLDERREILGVHATGKALAPDVDLVVLARGTPGMSGADLANLVNEAALHAARRSGTAITKADFESARDRILMGLKRTSLAMSDADKRVIAYHESGHAFLAYALEHADPLHKVTILPVGMALGVTQQLPEGERHIYQRPYLEDSLAVSLGGRVAEQVVFGTISTGAQNDLVGATELARRMVREWGMSDRIGVMAWGSQGAVFLGEDMLHTRDYSDETARVIDEEVERILREQEDRARRLIERHRDGLDALAAMLLEREMIDGAEVGRIIDDAAGEHVGGPRRPVADAITDAPA